MTLPWDRTGYPTSLLMDPETLAKLNGTPEEFHGDWHDVIAPHPHDA